MISQNKVNINDFIDILEMWYRDVILFKVTKDPNNLILRMKSIISVNQRVKVRMKDLKIS